VNNNGTLDYIVSSKVQKQNTTTKRQCCCLHCCWWFGTQWVQFIVSYKL